MVTINHATSNDANAIASPSLFPQKAEGRKPTADQVRLQKQLDDILRRIKSPVVEGACGRVFTDLLHLHDLLRIIEINVSAGGPLQVTLAVFSLIDNKSKSLIRFIEKQTSKIKSLRGSVRQVLDGMSFALRHELKRVFGHDLVKLSEARQTNQVRTDVMRAHGLLSNCFRQSIMTLVRAFNPAVSAQQLFDDYRDRLEQSVLLLKDLSSLLELARQAGEQQEIEVSVLLIGELNAFCQGPLHYLMYKDWEEFEDIAREVTASYGSARHGFMLHCFVMYLEALTNQVRMRAVLNDQSSDVRVLKPVKRSRGKRS
jgi:hypothetical protein